MATSIKEVIFFVLSFYVCVIFFVIYSQIHNSNSHIQNIRSGEYNNGTNIGGTMRVDIMKPVVKINNVSESFEVNNLTMLNVSLREKFNKDLQQKALLKFKKSIIKYGRFNADFTILLYDGNLATSMFKNWYNIQRRPTESPPLGSYESCAIVGNSGILLDSQCGHEIDEHEFVIRNNMAPTKGFENDVGTKTSLMSINSALAVTIVNCLENSTCQRTYMDKFKSLSNDSILWYSKVFSPSSRQKQYYYLSEFIKNNSLPLRIAFPRGKLSTTAFWKIKNASSGIMMLSIGTTFCQNITLYGFYPYSKSPTGHELTYHYYDSYSFKNRHNMDGEHKTLQKLNNQGAIRLVTDKCIY